MESLTNWTSKFPKPTHEDEANKLKRAYTVRITTLRTSLQKTKDPEYKEAIKASMVDVHTKRKELIQEWGLKSKHTDALSFEPTQRKRNAVAEMNVIQLIEEEKRLKKKRHSLQLRIAKARKKGDKKAEKELEKEKANIQQMFHRVRKMLDDVCPSRVVTQMRFVGLVYDDKGKQHKTKIMMNLRSCKVARNRLAKKLISTQELSPNSPFAPVSLNGPQ